MKKIRYLTPLIGLLIASCVTDKPDVITDDAGNLHYTTPYLDDTRGRNIFPLK
ncbi:murein L,D-transpeptidase [Legionella sp. PC1000]|nr:murein L,D-transpeptidase [Legionella sp. PC1000]